jgi:hypothetical protein
MRAARTFCQGRRELPIEHGDVHATVILGCFETMLLAGRRRSLHAKALAIENALGIASFDSRWTLPSLPERSPLAWMAEVNGQPVDLRDMSRDVQEIAFQRRIESL